METSALQLPSSVAEIIRRQARATPNSLALTYVDSVNELASSMKFTYRDLDIKSSRTANALIDAGVKAGDRVAILAHNNPLFFEVAFGANKIGAIVVGLNWRLAPIEIEAILLNADPSILILDDGLTELITSSTRESFQQKQIKMSSSWEVVVSEASDIDPMIATSPEDIAFILYTSGTTGVPKGVQLSNRNMSYSAWISGSAYNFSATSTNLVAMPLFHVGGMGYGLSAFFHGGHTVLLKEVEPNLLVSSLEFFKITHVFIVPAVLAMILDTTQIQDRDFSNLELLVYGAAPISESLLENALQILGCNFLQAYGMTETAGTIVTLPPKDHDLRGNENKILRSCGKVLPWVEIRIVDPKTINNNVAVDQQIGEVGEIWTRSEQNTPGYRNNELATDQAITKDGWLRTGDAAYIDENGYLFLFDRFKDMIVTGAENVYPAEVENVLASHPQVAEVAVIGVPDDRWGETIKAVVVSRSGEIIDSEELVNFCRDQLARYKTPTSFDFVKELPRNASGKILKKDLRAPYWVDSERQIS